MHIKTSKQKLYHPFISFLYVILFALSAVFASSAYAQNPKVKMETNLGTVVLELYADKAPLTVKNFLHYVKKGKYDNTVFHRVIKGFISQGGGYNLEYQLLETFPPIKNEADNGLENKRGTIAMARTNEPDSATNQFYINMDDNILLDHFDKSISGWGYCVFGQIIDGMEVMDKISQVKTGAVDPFPANAPVTQVSIRSISVIE